MLQQCRNNVLAMYAAVCWAKKRRWELSRVGSPLIFFGAFFTKGLFRLQPSPSRFSLRKLPPCRANLRTSKREHSPRLQIRVAVQIKCSRVIIVLPCFVSWLAEKLSNDRLDSRSTRILTVFVRLNFPRLGFIYLLWGLIGSFDSPCLYLFDSWHWTETAPSDTFKQHS